MTRRSKYGNKPQVVNGVRFDSIRELRRWSDLEACQRAGIISQLERQVPYVLAPSVRIAGEKRARPALKLTVDFRYFDITSGLFVIEDAKGKSDTAFRIRQHLMKSVHGIDVRIS